jgi:hypothetical protein
MRRFLVVLPVAVLAFVSTPLAQSGAKPPAPRRAAPAPRSPFQPTATVKDIMDDIMIPASDYVFGAVSSSSGPNGLEEKVPANDEEWAEVRKNARLIAEAGNLLMIDGRHVAPASAKSEHPGVELEPAQMDALVARNRPAWTKAAQGIVSAALVAMKAVEAKDPAALSDAGGDIDAACESCHVQFWYPDEKK